MWAGGRAAAWYAWTCILAFLVASQDVMLRQPLRALYQMAPSSMGYGGWSGQGMSEICAAISGTPVEFWFINTAGCEALVARRFESYFITFELVIYFGLLAFVLVWLICGCGFYTLWWCIWRRLVSYIVDRMDSPRRLRARRRVNDLSIEIPSEPPLPRLTDGQRDARPH